MLAIMLKGLDWIVDLQCPGCKELFTARFIAGIVTEPLEFERFNTIRKHAEACFKEEHQCPKSE